MANILRSHPFHLDEGTCWNFPFHNFSNRIPFAIFFLTAIFSQFLFSDFFTKIREFLYKDIEFVIILQSKMTKMMIWKKFSRFFFFNFYPFEYLFFLREIFTIFLYFFLSHRVSFLFTSDFSRFFFKFLSLRVSFLFTSDFSRFLSHRVSFLFSSDISRLFFFLPFEYLFSLRVIFHDYFLIPLCFFFFYEWFFTNFFPI